MSFVFSDNSRMNYNLSDLKTDQYIEVYFNIPVSDTVQESVPVIVSNLVGASIYRGEIVSVTPSSPESFSHIQTIEVKLENGSSMIFRCQKTQFGMELQDIKAGTNVSVYGQGKVSASSEDMTPRTGAYEFH